MSAKGEGYILFELAGSLYGIPSQSVKHLEMLEHVTPVPNANPAIDGVVFSRGQVFPALNLRARFGFPREAKTARTRVIFSTAHDRTVGLIVDSAREYRTLPAESIRPLEETLAGIKGKYLTGVTKVADRLVLLLDLEAVLDVSDVQLPETAESATATAAAAATS